MKFIQSSIAAACLYGSACSVSFAAAIVEAPEEIAVVAINQQEVKSGLFRSDVTQYKLDAGSHEISVRYDQMFRHSNGEHDVVKSNILTIQTPSLQDGQTYVLTLLPPPKDFETAKQFAAQPTIGLKTQQGQLIAQQIGADTAPKPWFEQGVFGRVYDLTGRRSSQIKSISVPTASTATVTAMAESSDRVSQLKQIWQSSSPRERQLFAAWLAEQAAR